MKKMLFLSCLLIPATTHCMEKEKQVTNRPLQYSDIEKEVNKLDELLYENQNWMYRHGNNDPLSYLVMCKYPNHVYGYVENNGAGKEYKGTLLTYDSKTLAQMNSLKNADYKGYSCIGATTLSTTVPYDEQKRIIQNLIKAGRKPTIKDTILIQHLEEKTGHNLPDGTSDILNHQTEESYRCNLLHQLYSVIVYLCSFCPINLTEEDKQDLHLG